MRIVLLGAPGAGKGTHADSMSKMLNIPHVSTGDIFRANIKNGTELGMQVKMYVDQGELVPDAVTVDIMVNRLKEPDCTNGFILDGFPRNVPQAKQLDCILEKMGVEIDKALYILVSDDVIINRMTGRRVCLNCGKVYNLVSSPPKNYGICDDCGCEVVQRKDDEPSTVASRLEIFRQETEPVIGYYEDREQLITVEGKQSAKETLDDIIIALGVTV